MPSPRRRVLVVDDEPQVAAMLSNVLTTLGYAVQVAGNGRDGISFVPEFRPEVVLLDLALPDLPGDLVLKCLRASDPHISVVMVTAHTDSALALHAGPGRIRLRRETLRRDTARPSARSGTRAPRVNGSNARTRRPERVT
jgi:CheY-like chemotaxis protein